MKAVAVAILVWALATPLGAQWLNHPTPGIPRTADGKPNLTAPAQRVLATYVGTYVQQPGRSRTIEITRSGDALFASVDGAGRLQLFAQSETIFSVKAPIEFVKDVAAPTAILEKPAGNDVVFQRIR